MNLQTAALEAVFVRNFLAVFDPLIEQFRTKIESMLNNACIISALATVYYAFQLQNILDYERIAKDMIHEIKLEKLDLEKINHNAFLAYTTIRSIGADIALAQNSSSSGLTLDVYDRNCLASCYFSLA